MLPGGGFSQHFRCFERSCRACLPQRATVENAEPDLAESNSKIPPREVTVTIPPREVTVTTNVSERTSSCTVLPVEAVIKSREQVPLSRTVDRPPQEFEVDLLNEACSPKAAARLSSPKKADLATSNRSSTAAHSIGDGHLYTEQQERYVDAVIRGELWEPLQQLAAMHLPSDAELARDASAACAVRSGCVRLLRSDYPILVSQHAGQGEKSSVCDGM